MKIIDRQEHTNGHYNVTEETTGTYQGRREFYSGLKPGDPVAIRRTRYFKPDGTPGSVTTSVRGEGCWLVVNAGDDFIED